MSPGPKCAADKGHVINAQAIGFWVLNSTAREPRAGSPGVLTLIAPFRASLVSAQGESSRSSQIFSGPKRGDASADPRQLSWLKKAKWPTGSTLTTCKTWPYEMRF